MTNKQAFESYYANTERAELVLSVNGIDPALEDQLEFSAALGMKELALDPNYKQGKTSQSLDSEGRKRLLSEAESIINKHKGVSTDKPSISSIKW